MVITNSGISIFKLAMIDKAGSSFLFGAVGSSGVTPAVTDVRLTKEVFRSATDRVDKSVTDKITTSLEMDTTEANSNTLREFGWFETSGGSTGTAFIRDTLNSITKTSDISLFLDTTISVSVVEI